MQKPAHQVVAEQLTQLMDQVDAGPWDLYEAGRDRDALRAAQALKDFAISYKDSGATAGARFKVAPGMTTVELPIELATTLAAARADEGDKTVIAALARLARPGPSVGARLSDDEKPATKAAEAQRVSEMERRFKIMYDELGLTDAEAQRMGYTYKDAPAAAPLTPIQQIARQTMPELYGLKGKTR